MSKGCELQYLGGNLTKETFGKKNCDICGAEYEPLTYKLGSGDVVEYPWGNLIRIDHADNLKRGKYMYKYRTCPSCSRKVIDFINTMVVTEEEK